jgi:hypothetical protein
VYETVVGEQVLMAGEVEADVELLRELAQAVVQRDQVEIADVHPRTLPIAGRTRKLTRPALGDSASRRQS